MHLFSKCKNFFTGHSTKFQNTYAWLCFQMTLLRIFLEFNVCPNVIRNGKNIILLEIHEFRVRFITSNNYISGNEYQLAKQFGIPFSKLLFPESLLLSEHFDFVGKIPQFEFFYSIDGIDEMELNYYTENRKGQKWSFKENLITFIDQKVRLLLDSFIEFIRQSFTFQSKLQMSLAASMPVFINPFNNPLCTLGSFVFLMYKIFYMNRIPIFIVENEYGKNQKQVSKLEHEYSRFMDHLHPELKFQYAFNNKEGPKYFKEAVPDLYSPVTKEIFFFNGCYFHGHYDQCLMNKKILPESKHPFGVTYKELNQQFFEKLEKLMHNHPEITKATIEWECNFLKKKKTPEASAFFANFSAHCLRRLTPRDTVRGSFSDVYALKWSKKQFPNETFYCTDVNGLYSFCAINFKYMIGKYQILIGRELEKLQIINNQFFFKGDSVMGAMLVKILPPKKLFAPYLLYRKKDGSVVNTLCRLCSETNSISCNHGDEDKSFIASYMISEIEFALSLNYRVLQIYEAHVYTQKDFILKDFVQKLNFFKTLNSNCLKEIPPDQHFKYCANLNEKMKLSEKNFTLKPELIVDNPAHRNYFKLLSNALFGKFIQRTDQTEIKYVKNQDEINETYFSAQRINDFFCPNENLCMLFVKKNVFKLPPNRKQNVYIGSQITAFARETIYRHLQNVLATPDSTIYQVECDSLYFSLPSEVICPVPLSHAVGDFKIEHSNNILSFYSFGPKHYNICYINSKNEIENICKFSGLSLKNNVNQNLLTEKTFEMFLDAFVSETEKSFVLYQAVNSANIKHLTVTEKQQKFTVRNKISKRRIVHLNNISRLITFPHGYEN